jgi:hypothetical protein
MTLLKILFILLGCTAQMSENRSEGMLKPKGIYTGIDSIGIDAKFGNFEGNQQVFIERVEDTGGLPPISPNPRVSAAIPYYRIGSTKAFNRGSEIHYLG